MVPKKQQYHIRLTIGQGSQLPVDMTDGITAITRITEKHLDPRAPELKFTLDDQLGLRLSAPVGVAPNTYMLRILGEGCYQNQCGLSFNTKATVTVVPPTPAPAGTEHFSQPSQDRIDNAAPLPAGGATLRDELIITLGTPDEPGTLSRAVELAALVGATVTGGIEALGVYELRWASPQDLAVAKASLEGHSDVAGVSRTTVGLIQNNALPPGDWDDDGNAATWPFTQIRAQQAWDTTTGGPSVSVGIVDSGAVYKDHEDLNVSRVLSGSADHHATHVAGLVCARDNGLGLVGVSWGCPIVSSGSGGLTDKEVLEAMRNVARSGVRVINASLGYGARGRANLCLASDESRQYNEEAQNNSAPFWQLFNGADGRNIIWTFAAGNNCADGPQSPWGATWSLPNVITVAATNSDGTLASFSNFGLGVEVAAPGGAGVGISGGDAGVWSTSVESCFLFFSCGTYKQDMGTSMAAPVVAGVAALAQSANPDKKAADVASCVLNTAGRTVGSASSRSSQPQLDNRTPRITFTGTVPIVNAEAAVQCVKNGTGPANVLIAGAGDRTGSGNGTDIGDLSAALVRAGHTVSTSQTLPADLSPYQQIWYIDTNALTAQESDRLADFVASGGSAYLTGEWGCCAVDTSTIALLNRLTTNTGGHIAHAGSAPFNSLTVNSAAPGGLATDPHALSSITVASAGSLSGVPQGNIFAYSSDPSTAAFAGWDRSNVQGGGRLVVGMDINWFAEQYRGSNWEDVAQNIARFLARP
ncbi:S8 family peptidase [Rhizocola hellebori]|uniref:S8 family peptidase n=1 Tax=Rhizocola hellebori TaxID=1392758 RepID=UPI0019412A1D|nr:S8 family serine peptidase [Rhizocola hellebori]